MVDEQQGARGQPRVATSELEEVELGALGLKKLRIRAADIGISEDAIEDARDSGQPKEELITLVVTETRIQQLAAGEAEQQERLTRHTAAACPASRRRQMRAAEWTGPRARARLLGVVLALTVVPGQRQAAAQCGITESVCGGYCVSPTTNCCRDSGEYACSVSQNCCGGTCCGVTDNCCGNYCVGMMDSCGGSSTSSGGVTFTPTQSSTGSGSQTITFNAGSINTGESGASGESGTSVVYIPAPALPPPPPPPPSFFDDTAGKIVTVCGVLTAIGGVWACWRKNTKNTKNTVHARGP
jgi:hypothetical protein